MNRFVRFAFPRRRRFSILPDRALLNIKAILYNKPVIFRFALVQPNLSLDLWSLARARMRNTYFLALKMLSLAAGEFQIRPNVGVLNRYNFWIIHGQFTAIRVQKIYSCSKNIRVYSCIFMCIRVQKNIIVFLNFLDKRRLMFLRVLARGKGLSAPGKGIKGRKERLFWM